MTEYANQAPIDVNIDLSYLNEVSSGSREFIVEMIDMFLEQTPVYFEQLNEAIQAQDWLVVAHLAHKVKPTLAFMGTHSAKDKIAEIEHKARNQENLEEISLIFNQIYSQKQQLFNNLKEAKESLEGAD